MSNKKLKEKNHTSYFTPRTSNKGITLIALIITIIVMMILVAVTVTFTIGENGILNTAKEAKFKTEVAQLKEQFDINLEVAKMDKNFKVEDLYANKELGNLKEWIPTIQEKYEEKLYIEQGILYGNDNLSQQEKEWLQEIGIECNVATAISNTDLWELSTTNSKNDTIEKYKGTVSNGDSLSIPPIIVDKTTGETYRIKRVNECFDDHEIGGLRILLSNITIPDNITIKGGAFDAYEDTIYTENLIIGNNVVFEGVNCFSNQNILSTIKVGNNVDLGPLVLETMVMDESLNKGMKMTIGDNCSNFEDFYCFKVINIGKNATISRCIGFISEQINIGIGLTLSDASPASQYSSEFCKTPQAGKSLNVNLEGIKKMEKNYVRFPSSENVNVKINIEDDAIILDDAFSGNSIKNVTIGKNVSVGKYAFDNCTGITKLTIEEGATIGKNAFNGCTNIAEVIIGENTSVAETAFEGCTGIENLTIGKGATIEKNAFKGCTNITELVIPENASIGQSAFEDCTGIEELTIGKGAVLGRHAFKGCTNILEVTIPQNASVGQSAFNSCTGITKVIIEEGAIMEGAAFELCSSLKEAVLGNIELLDDPFGCDDLEKLTIADGTVLNIEFYSGYQTLKTLIIGNNVTLGEWAFYEFESLENVTIGDNSTIGDEAFYMCPVIKEMVIGNSTLSETAFLDATIETIRINKTKAEVGDLAPWGANAGVKVIYSNGEEVTY